MPRFYFQLNECGKVLSDPEGVEMRDLDEARARAVIEARTIMCAEVAEGRLCLSCSIEVRDAGGLAVLDVPFREAVRVSGV